ncbi:MAG: SDR family oxidoreductase [Saprospiraceae bacterium]|nr:SDR family oxidoreductase [Saprospiraceae bacterium]
MKQYIVTGASRGIGRETALALAAEPSNWVLALSRDTTGLSRLSEAAQAAGAGDRLHCLPFDLAQPDWPRLLEEINQWGKLDGLINNAGLLIHKPFEELSVEDWQRMFQVNCFGVVALVQQVLPLLEAAQGAHIVNISSMGGFQGSSKFNGLSAYSASKAALANLTETLAEEFQSRRIAVNCLALGAVQTEMLAQAFPGYAAPLTSEEMGGFVAWFAAHGNRFFNGKILPVSVSTP